ncbi:MAG: FeoA family protein [Longimicrobiales bacterium]
MPDGSPSPELRLADIPLRETVELVRIDLPDGQVESLFERGMLPGCSVCPVRRSPSGDPIVSVHGSLLALRREMAGCICVRRLVPAPTPAAAP